MAHIKIVNYLAPHYVFDVIMTNKREEESKVNLYFQGVINYFYLTDRMDLNFFDNIQIAMIRLIVPETKFMPSKEELNKLFPISETEEYDEWFAYKYQYQNTIFQWQKIDKKIGDLKNINYTLRKKSEARFIFFVREPSMESMLNCS